MTDIQSPTPDFFTALNDAVLAIAEGLSLPRTLQRIADTARVLAQTKYAALGILGDDGVHLKQFITSGIEPQLARHINHEPSGDGLLGNIFREGKAIRVANIHQDPRSAGFCDNHPIMTSFLGVPITLRGKRIGNLYLCDRLDHQPFDQRDEDMLTFLASHVAIAIENATLHEDLQVAALRSERDRIGMELHDGVIQSIYATGMKIDILQNKLNLNDGQRGQFETILGDLNHVIDDIRSYIRNLIATHEEQPTLRTYIENIITHFRDFSGVKVVTEIAGDLPMLSDFQRHNVLQILRESLANVAHHAQATQVHLSIRATEREFIFSVVDNGKGFDVGMADTIPSNHFGLLNMRQRVRRLGGTLELESQASQGVKLTVTIPVQPA